MKIKTPPINVDKTVTKIDGDADLTLDSQISSTVNVPTIKLEIHMPQIWLAIDIKKQGSGYWKFTGHITPMYPGDGIPELTKTYEGPPITIDTKIDQSNMIHMLLEAILKGTAKADIK